MNRQNIPTLNQPGTRVQTLDIQDETAQLRAQIAREYGMLTWAKTHITEESAKQLYITRRQSTINECHAKLGRLVGKQQAQSIIWQIIEQTSTTTQQTNYTRPLE